MEAESGRRASCGHRRRAGEGPCAEGRRRASKVEDGRAARPPSFGGFPDAAGESSLTPQRPGLGGTPILAVGGAPTVVARILGVGRTSLYRWLAMAEKSPEAPAARPHPGPRARPSDVQVGELERLLLEGARSHVWPNDLWSAGRVAEHVRKILRRQLRWSSQRPQKKARQRDQERIDH